MERYFDEWEIVVSSTDIVTFLSYKQNGKSLVKVRNRSRPRQKPWETAQHVSLMLQKLELNLQNSFLPCKEEALPHPFTAKK